MPANSPRDAGVRSVLLVDDNDAQRRLSQSWLAAAGFSVVAVDGAEAAVEAARRARPDVVLSDVLMRDVDGFGLCRRLRAEPSLAGVPVVLASAYFRGATESALAAEVGAFALVERTAEFTAELAAVRAALAASVGPAPDGDDPALYERHLRAHTNHLASLVDRVQCVSARYGALLENATDAIALLSVDGVIHEVNRRWPELLGVSAEAMVGRHMSDFAAEGFAEENARRFSDMVSRGGSRDRFLPVRRADGATLYMEIAGTVIEEAGEKVVISIGHDVTAQVLNTRDLESAEARYRLLLDRIPEVVWTARQAGQVTFVTDNVSRLFGLDPEEIYADGERFLFDGTHPEDRPALQAAFEAMRSKSEPFDVVFRWRRGDEPWMWLRNRAVASYEVDGTRYVEGMLSDVTAERKMEEALRQAQKMEAIGQLTGGIAHDFNNILAAIVSNTYFLTEALEEGDPRRADADEIQVAVERASALTRQLLAFSRRQVLAPTCFDINDTVRGLERMLRRLIGEDVEFVIRCAEGIGKVRADVGQVEQVVMNLVVNARDAMPTGGKLTIETADVELDAGYAADHPTVAPGAYVVVSVSDTGCGMSREVQARLFEPFFTTKEQGKGTGLGLSTAYGIVKQSGGHISVYSEVGHGTVFRVYLPRVDARPETARRSDIGQPGGTETILVVEDDERLRAAVTRILSGKGYRLLVAGDGASALKLLGEHEGPVHLVLSDAIMPGMSGPEAVREVQRCSPETRALFMSGYTDHAVLREGALQSRVNFIQKPFAPHALLRKVREVLDA